MNVNKIIITIGIIIAIFITFIFIQFNPFAQRGVQENVATKPPSTVVINDQTFNVYVTRTDEEKQKGLSGRQSLALDEGMIFLFDQPDLYSFWMKDMQFPIDIIFINNDKIVSIAENAEPQESGDLPIYQPTGPVNRVLEINAGLSKKYNFKAGDTVTFNLK